MPALRYASASEIEAIKDQCDLGPGCTVVAEDTATGPSFAVIRQCIEVDPVMYAEGSGLQHHALLIRDIEHFLMGSGTAAYYFNVPTDNEPWRAAVEKWGAGQVSKAAEYRYKKVILRS